MNGREHKISVVIPAYKAEKTIERALKSVLKQKEVDEIIVVEDGGQDETLALCQALAKEYPKIKVLQHEGGANLGPSATRNKGIAAAKNDWIAFLDADDYYLNNRFAETIKTIEAKEKVDGVYEAIAVAQNNKEGKLTTLNRTDIKCEDLFYEITPIGNAGRFCADGFTVKKTILEEAGMFEEDMRIGEDVLLWLKCAIVASLYPGNIHQAVTHYTREEDSITSNIEVKYYLIEVYQKLLAWTHPLFKRSHRVKVINKLLYIKLQAYQRGHTRLVGLLKYLAFILITLVKYPYYFCTKDFVSSIKDFKNFVKN